jgi:hypothetical protein
MSSPALQEQPNQVAQPEQPISFDEKLNRLLALIPSDGSPKGNIRLLRESGLTEDEYWLLRNKLIEQGKIGKARGMGGAVYLLNAEESPERIQKRRRRKSVENDLYEDFEKWLGEFWAKDVNLTWFRIEKTAHQGSRQTGGRWTRPDFAIVAVNTYRYFPGKFLELISFEVKPKLSDALAGVFECAAHSVYANRSFLAVCVEDEADEESEDFARIERECERFGLGLVTFSDVEDMESYKVQVEANRRTPDPSEVDKFIASQLKESTQELVAKQIK